MRKTYRQCWIKSEKCSRKQVLLVLWHKIALLEMNASSGILLEGQVGLHNVGYSVCLLILDITSVSIFWLIFWVWGRGASREHCLTWEIKVLHILKAFTTVSKVTFRKATPRLTACDTFCFPKHLTKVGFNLCHLDREKGNLVVLIFSLN